MLNARYERTMEHSYVSFEVNEYRKTFEEEMLKNAISGVLPFQVECQDDRVCFSYNITQKLEFMEYIQQMKLSTFVICKLLNHIILNIKAAREYLLEADNFVLDSSYIYVGDGGESFWLCYYIGYQQPVREQLNRLFETWMKQIDYDDHKTVKLVYELYRISRMETCTYDQILELLAKESKEIELPFGDQNDVSLDQSIFMEEEITQEVPGQSEDRKKKQEKMIAMVEELKGEREELYYPIFCYVKMIASIVAGIVGLSIILKTSFLQTKSGEIDVMKVLCFLLVILVAEFLIGRALFQPERKLSRMREEVDYVSIHENQSLKSVEQSVYKPEGVNFEIKHLSQIRSEEMQQNKNNSYDKCKVEGSRGACRKEEVRPQLSLGKTEAQMALGEEGTKLLVGEEETKLLIGEEETRLLFGEGETQLLLKTKRLLLQSQQINTETLEIMAKETIIGSSIRQSDLVLQYPTISRTHARVSYREDNFYLEDLSSMNGTFFNGKRMLPGEQQELADEDIVQFAEYTYGVSIQME